MNLCRTTMRLGLIVLPICLATIAGCDKDDTIQRYEVAKTSDTPAAGTTTPAGPVADAQTPIHWIIPAGWKQLPGNEMRYASFAVSADHPDLQVTVVPLAGAGGSLLGNINRWEGQIGLPPSSEDDLKGLIKTIVIAGTPAVLVDRTGAEPDDHSSPKRILAAILVHGDRTWFFKLTGTNDLVAGQKDNFDTFVQSVRFDDMPPAPTDMTPPQIPVAATPADATALPITFALPTGWQQETASQAIQFRVVAFKVASGADTAEAVVSHVVKDSGTMLENINRWRGQVDLDPVTDANQVPTAKITTRAGDAVVWDFENTTTGRRMIVAMVAHGDQWWFFKISGGSPLITAQKSNFNSFVASIQFRGDAGE